MIKIILGNSNLKKKAKFEDFVLLIEISSIKGRRVHPKIL